jgi:osmoprotectant transport system substrate-binding protein
VVRMDTVASNPKAVEALERVGALIDNPTMQELNRQVEVDKKEPRAVAASFLKAKGVIR